MDVKILRNSNVLKLQISLAEAKDIEQLVDNFNNWDLIGDAENRAPMMFMLEFGRECLYAADNIGTDTYPIASGVVPLSSEQVTILTKFIKACVDTEGDQMAFAKRKLLDMAWKTLDNRLSTSQMQVSKTTSQMQGSKKNFIWGLLSGALLLVIILIIKNT